MVNSDDDNDFASISDGEPPEPLAKWERICALIIGTICGGAGGYAVFEKSNQAGTATLLILAAIFLLIGVQGTPLIKFGSNSGSVELERRRRRKVQEALEQASEENNTEKAEGIVEGVKIVAPDLVPMSLSPYRKYEDDVAGALSGMGYEVAQEVSVGQFRIDLQITRNGRAVYGEIKYYRRAISPEVVRQVIGTAYMLSAPVLLISNRQLTDSAQSIIDRGNVDFIQWRDQADNPQLGTAIERLLAEVNAQRGDVTEPSDSD